MKVLLPGGKLAKYTGQTVNDKWIAKADLYILIIKEFMMETGKIGTEMGMVFIHFMVVILMLVNGNIAIDTDMVLKHLLVEQFILVNL